MSLLTILKERVDIWRTIFVRPWVRTFVAIYGVMGFLDSPVPDFIVAQLLPVKYHYLWDTYYVMPDFSLQTWIMILLAGSVVILLEGSYRVISGLRSELSGRERMDTRPSLDYQAVEKLAEARREIADLKAQLAPRSLSSDQRDNLLRFLKKQDIAQAFVWFGHYVSVSDGASFAYELSEVFKRAGWHTAAREISANPTTGISVTGGTRQDRETIIQAMSAVGLSVHSDSDYDDPVPMHVIIGPKPPA